MNEKILTISIAAYNVEKFIKRTLDSIVDSKMLDDIEVFIVDDGGNDNTYDIAKTYEKKYHSVFYAVHKTNGGYGSTVNYSIDNATGKYFKLLDGDDWYDSDGLKMLISKLKNTNVDMVVTKFDRYFSNYISPGINFDENYYNKIFDIKDFKYYNGIEMHATTFKTEVLKKSKMRLKEHSLYTDNTYDAIPLLYVKNLIIYDFVVYNYQLGLADQSVNRQSFLKHINELYEICCDLIEFHKKNLEYILNNNDYLTSRVSATLIDYFGVLMFKNISKETLNEIKNFDNMIYSEDIHLYKRMENLNRKASRFLKILRKSHYLLYYPMHLFYKICKRN